MFPPDDDECVITMHSNIINLAQNALRMARGMYTIVDVSLHTATVRKWIRYLQCPLTAIDTNEKELTNLEQQGYESAARMHLDLARSQEKREISRRNVSAFCFYAGISERSLAFFGTDTDELKRLGE